MALNIRHAPLSKNPVTPHILRAALRHLPPKPSPIAVKQAILMMYIGFFRQSSLSPNTVASFDPTRHITCADVWPFQQGLHVRLKWTKTIQRSRDAKVILLPPITDQTLCPVKDHAIYEAARPPSTGPDAPYIAFGDGNPLTTRALARAWAHAVEKAGFSPSKISLHSLRRGGASFAYNVHRADLNDVMTQGTWRSMAVRDYIRPPDAQYNTVHEALQCL